MQSDLRTVSNANDIFKYASETTLLVPENIDVQLERKFQHILSWAANNHIIIKALTHIHTYIHTYIHISFIDPYQRTYYKAFHLIFKLST
jgi:hypothetical protein